MIAQALFSVILADPPWSYRDKCNAGKRGAGFKYDTMSIEEIQSLDVQSIAAEDCVLFLWVTYPLMKEGLDTIKAWGFEYKTVAFTWIKTNKLAGTPFWGMGNWTRSNAENCLLAVKGKPKRVSKSVHSVIMSPVRKHSQKPDEARERIVQLCGDVPRVELFARDKAQGWDVWGDEIESDLHFGGVSNGQKTVTRRTG